MKILCISKNYSESSVPLVFFMKPDTALLQRNRPFYIPEWTQEVQAEVALVLKICKNGKYIQERFAHTYYDAVSVGIDFTAHDIQNDLMAHRLPWEKSKVFDRSAPIGTFLPKEQLNLPQGIRFTLKKNGETVQSGNSLEMCHSFDRIIVELSQYVTLKMGDLIFTGTPATAETVQIGDLLEAFIEDKMLLRVLVR